jgi:hypothetical protein
MFTIVVLGLLLITQIIDSFQVSRSLFRVTKHYSVEKPNINDFFYKPPSFRLDIKDVKEEATITTNKEKEQQKGNPIETFLSNLFPSKTSKESNSNSNSNELVLINNEISTVRSLLIKASNKEIPYIIGKKRDGDVDISYTTNSKALQELNWTPKRDLQNMCDTLWKWQSNNHNGYNS